MGRFRLADWIALAAGAVASYAVRSAYFWATRRTYFPPPWYESVAHWLVWCFVALIVVGFALSPRWPPLGRAAVGAALTGLVLAVYTVLSDRSVR